MLLVLDRLLAGRLDQMVRVALADLFGQRHRHRFRHDQSARRVEIDAHARGVDFQPLGDIDDRRQRARGDQQQRRQRRPFRVPGTGAALVVLHLRRKDRRREIGGHGGRRQRTGGRNRIALVRHGGGAAAAFAGWFERFADIGLHHQRNVARDLAAGAGDDGEHRGRFRDAVAVGVPGRVGQRQLELLRQSFRDLQSLVAEGGERAGGAAELQRQRLAAQALQPQLRAVQRRGIFGELQSERHRQRMLQPGAGDHRGIAVLTRQSGKARDGAIDVGEQRVDAGAKAEHGAGIDHVLAGRAPMHITRRLGIHPGDIGRQRLDERDGEVAGPGGGVSQGSEVE